MPRQSPNYPCFATGYFYWRHWKARAPLPTHPQGARLRPCGVKRPQHDARGPAPKFAPRCLCWCLCSLPAKPTNRTGLSGWAARAHTTVCRSPTQLPLRPLGAQALNDQSMCTRVSAACIITLRGSAAMMWQAGPQRRPPPSPSPHSPARTRRRATRRPYARCGADAGGRWRPTVGRAGKQQAGCCLMPAPR